MRGKIKRTGRLIMAIMLAAIFAFAPSVEAFAQQGSFTVSAGSMVSRDGQLVGPNRTTSPSINEAAVVTSIVIQNIAFTTQSAPLYIYLVAPCGAFFRRRFARGASFPVTINDLNGVRARGVWEIYIRNAGLSPTPGVGAISQITSARITVNHRT